MAPAKETAKKKSQPGRYSQLVIDTIRNLGEKNGSSLAKIYSEAKKVSWFDQQNGRTYLKYSIKALVQNDTLLQVKGVGANGSFRLNKAKLERLSLGGKKKKAPSPPPAKPAKKASAAPKKSPKKALKSAAKPQKAAAKSPKKKKAAGTSKKVKKSAKPSVPKVPKAKPKVSKAKKA
ncbi:histone H1.10 [Bombina bombina]|uniref:histone H1.10 n=1 Tax=Bombina bombina TaxID=8345 RepID=UPI00235A9CEF|nr:histone H1.10 [Bombina bombina]